MNRRYLDDDSFRRDYPRTAAKIQAADAALWSADESQLTVVGHACREAKQMFASEALDRLGVAPEQPDVQHTVARARQVMATIRMTPSVGTAEGKVLDALARYWIEVVNLVQRQEHGGQREAEPVTHEDARGVLFQTINATHEIARSVERALSSWRPERTDPRTFLAAAGTRRPTRPPLD